MLMKSPGAAGRTACMPAPWGTDCVHYNALVDCALKSGHAFNLSKLGRIIGAGTFHVPT